MSEKTRLQNHSIYQCCSHYLHWDFGLVKPVYDRRYGGRDDSPPPDPRPDHELPKAVNE